MFTSKKVQEPLPLSEKIDPPSELLVRKPFSSTLNFFVATLIIESYKPHNNQLRCKTLIDLLQKLSKNLKNGIAIFPAGMFDTENKPPSSIYPEIEKSISSFLSSIENQIVVCFGIDGSNGRDQVAVAVDRTGIIALGKKFYQVKEEKGHVNLAENFNTLENGKPRIFNFGNSSFYLGMCYDSFGIKKQKIKNPGVSGFIELAHCFYPKGEGPSGESYFARHGFAGTAYQWNCTVYGTAVFFNRKVPENWPTGVIWNQGSISTKTWKYSLNPLKPVDVEHINIDEGNAVVRLFPMP